LTMVECGQGFRSMSEPSKKFEELIVAKQLRHGGHPVLRWMVSNVAKREDPAGNIKPDKAASSDRIDGVVASIMALGRAIVAPPEHDGGWLMADLTGDVQ
jgi:phage terminase large subunit-like protein